MTKFQPGDKVRWNARARLRLAAGDWNEKNIPLRELEWRSSIEVNAVYTVIAVYGSEEVILDIEPDHPFFNSPSVAPIFVEHLSPLEQLAQEAE